MYFENLEVQNAIFEDLLLKGVDYEVAANLIKNSSDMIYIYERLGIEIPKQFLIGVENIKAPEQIEIPIIGTPRSSNGNQEPDFQNLAGNKKPKSKLEEKYEKLSFKQKPANLIYQSGNIVGPEKYSYEGFSESFEDIYDEESKNEVNYFDPKTIPIIKVRLDNKRNFVESLNSGDKDAKSIDIENYEMLNFCYEKYSK